MKRLAAAATIGLIALALVASGLAHAEVGEMASVVESVLVTENGRPIGSLRSPQPGSGLGVEVQAGEDHQLQAIVQLSAAPGERFLLLTDLEDALIAGLSEEGLVGSVLQGGWSLDPRKEQMVHINVSGRRPSQADGFDLLQALIVTQDGIMSEFRVEARVVRPVTPLPGHVIAGGAGAGAAAVIAIALVVWRRSHRSLGTEWSY